jgi:hypothetical protein
VPTSRRRWERAPLALLLGCALRGDHVRMCSASAWWVACALGAVVMAHTFTSATAQTPWRFELVGGWGGPINEFERIGDIGYAAIGQRLVTLDVNDPANMFELDSVNLSAAIQGMAIRDGIAYVSTRDNPNEFAVVDVSDPTDLTVLASLTIPDQPRDSVQLHGDLAFVNTRFSPAIYDVSDPAAPQFLSQPNVLNEAGVVRFIGSYLIEGDQNDTDIRVWDMSNPGNPVLKYKTTVFPFGAQRLEHIVIDGTMVYVLAGHTAIGGADEEWVVMYDFSDPESPQQVSQHLVTTFDHVDAFDGNAFSMEVANGIVYVAVLQIGMNQPSHEASRGLVMIDVTDPANPVDIGSYKSRGAIAGARVYGDLAYVFDYGEGLVVLDISDSADPVRLGNYHSPAAFPDMVRDGDRLYVSDIWNGVSILDISDPTQPVLEGAYQTRPEAAGVGNWGIDYHDGAVYLSTTWAGFEIIDVTTPSAPVLAGGFFPWPDGVQAGDLKFNPTLGNILHVGKQPGAFLVNFDVSDPANVVEVGSVFLGGGAPFIKDVELSHDNRFAHIVRGSVGIDAVDVLEDPMMIASQLNTPGGGTLSPHDATILRGDGDTYTRYTIQHHNSLSEYSLWAQDLTDPYDPGEACGFGQSWDGDAVDAVDGLLLQVRADDELYAWSIADPCSPALLANHDSESVGHSFGGSLPGAHTEVDWPYVFAAGSAESEQTVLDRELAGVVILKLTCLADFNGDGDLNILDLVAFQNAFVMQDEDADVNGDGALNILDFVAFQGIFQTGCL